MIEDIRGDAFASGVEVLIHQANCYHSMNSGIARVVRERFPEAYAADLATPMGSLEKLGTFSTAPVTSPAAADPATGRKLLHIVNLYSQWGTKDGDRKTSYDAMYAGLVRIREDARFAGRVLGVPYKIGCGLGGGDWKVVRAILESVFANPRHILLVCEKP